MNKKNKNSQKIRLQKLMLKYYTFKVLKKDYRNWNKNKVRFKVLR